MRITGRTGVYLLIGDPIGHAKTPELYNQEFALRGIDVVVVPMRVETGNLGRVVEMARSWENLVGIGVTIPHKEEMVDLVDDLTMPASLCGATNVVKRGRDGRLIGTQMDGPGFVRSLQGYRLDYPSTQVLLIGAGGTAKAIAFELAAQGVRNLVLENRTQERALALAKSVRSAYPECNVTVSGSRERDHDLIINATSVGMGSNDPLPLDPKVLHDGAIVADVIMSPAETALLREATRRGCPVHPGQRMLEAQFEATLRFLEIEEGFDS